MLPITFFCAKLLETAFLKLSVDEPLEVVLAISKKVATNQICEVLINFGQGVY